MALVPVGFHKINNVCERRENWRLIVKLVRVWNMCSIATPNYPYATEMVFVDEEGSTIEATIQKHLMNKFANAVVEGEVYKLTNFGVTTNSGKFRVAGHDFKLVFDASTKMVPCPSAPIPSLGLSLLKTSDIAKTNGRSEYLLDFMGILTAVSEEMILSKERHQTRMMLLDLVDEMGEVRCALFGDLIDVVNGHLAVTSIGLPVVVIQLARVNFYKDRSHPISIRDEFLELYPRKTLGQLVDILEEGFFIVLCTVSEIVQETSWWYMARPCMKVVSFATGVPYCKDCHSIVIDMTPRYTLKVFVSDGADSAQLIMFDSECFTILNKPCKELVADTKDLPCGEYPEEITKLVGKEFMFRLEKKEDTVFSLDESYRCRRVCSNSSKIAEFKEEVDEDTPLKLKFALAFSKIPQIEGDTSASNETPHSTSIVTVLDVSPNSCGPASSLAELPGHGLKRELERSVEGPAE
ncbi:hypothetical protein SESBI_04066 [Sesbania bispinosa]|nr:hypothetical protein SESBI_04066 [Sesbania bispinosa]